MPKAKVPQRTASPKPLGRAARKRYLAVALETGGPRLFVDALNNVVRYEGADRIAKIAGVSRRDVALAFSAKGRGEISTLLEIVEATGRRLKLESR